MNNSRDILMEIVGITSGSNRGKEIDVDDFCTMIEVQVMYGLVKGLPGGKQQQVMEEFVSAPSYGKVADADKILGQYYTQAEMRGELKIATKKAIVKEIVEPNNGKLSASERERIWVLLEKLTC
jgi:hypothetical protein